MFVNIFTYKAREGQGEAVMSLLDEWDRERRPHAPGFVSAEVYRDVKDPRSFINIARFESIEAAQGVSNDPAQDAWFRRLVALCEAEPVFTDCDVAWQSR